tara:strand:- start:626 stop:1030 length:405 start_codon:yes stop_codon:yes gene_type:complete
MRNINKAIIHCTATPEGRDIGVSEVRSWHMAKGWSDIGYHFLITLNGTVEVGRPIERIGAHCKGQNRDSIGIAYTGGVEEDGKTPKDTRTIEQKEMLRWLIDDLKKKYDFSDVEPHNKYANKACPCFDVYSEEY